MAKSRLYVYAPDEGTRIEVLDPSLQPVTLEHNTGATVVDVEPGIYAVRFRRGLAMTERVAVVGRDAGDVHLFLQEDEEPTFSTAAPVIQPGEPHPAHQRSAESLSHSPPHVVGPASARSGGLLLFVRADDVAVSRLDAGMTLHALRGEEVVRIEELGESRPDEGWAGIHLQLAEGAYRIRRQFAGTNLEQVVHVRHGWQTQYFAKAVLGAGRQPAEFALLSVMMAEERMGFDGSRRDGRHTEAALRALRERSAISGPMSEELLHWKFENPLLGVMGALLQLRRKDLSVTDLRIVVENLLKLIGPTPDVLAIGLAMLTRESRLRDEASFRERICDRAALEAPPYFSESWRHICAASEWDHTLTPPHSLAARVASSTTEASPWFRWRVTSESALASKASPPSALVLKGSGPLVSIANLALAAFKITPEKIESFNANVLNRVLTAAQTELIKVASVAELLRSPGFSDADRRVAAFVYPLADPAIDALLSGAGTASGEMRNAVLERARDGRQFARALQLPLGTAILRAAGLWGKLKTAASECRLTSRVEAFLTAESQGDSKLRSVLESLKETTLPLRWAGSKESLNALEYLVWRYEEAALTRSARKKPIRVAYLIDANTGHLADVEKQNVILRSLQDTLAVGVSKLIEGGELSPETPVRPAIVSTLDEFQRGGLFPVLAPAPESPTVLLPAVATPPVAQATSATTRSKAKRNERESRGGIKGADSVGPRPAVKAGKKKGAPHARRKPALSRKKTTAEAPKKKIRSLRKMSASARTKSRRKGKKLPADSERERNTTRIAASPPDD